MGERNPESKIPEKKNPNKKKKKKKGVNKKAEEDFANKKASEMVSFMYSIVRNIHNRLRGYKPRLEHVIICTLCRDERRYVHIIRSVNN